MGFRFCFGLILKVLIFMEKDCFFIGICRMESAYRTWVRQKREGVKSVDLDELCRELQTALGTAKWQVGF